MPKVDLHRHLEGAIRLESLVALGLAPGNSTGEGLGALRKQMTHTAGDPHEAGFFLTRFKTIRELFHDREVIEKLTRAVISDAASDNVRYLELRLTPAALAARGRFGLDEVTGWVVEAATHEAHRHDLTVRFLLSFNRHEPASLAHEVLEIALARRDLGIVGLDLAGDERTFPAEPFAAIMVRARDEGLGTSVHAGEWGDSDQVAYAIRELGANRIGHGVQIIHDATLVDEARKAGVSFEVSLTSNERTGAVQNLADHPLVEMLQAGLQVALTTDDPGIFETTLSEEHAIAVRSLGLSIETIKGMTLSAIQASFLDRKSKQALEKTFVQALWGGGQGL